MNKSKFPLQNKEKLNYDTKMCLWRKTNKVLEPHSFASISAGTVLLDPNDPCSGGPSDKMGGYLDFSWHGAHTNEGGKGIRPDTYAYLPITKACKGGQSEFLFCSTDCLRAFLNYCVDELERRIE
jgi:hypothetical protein